MKDFFISYNRHDQAITQWIAWILEEAGFSVVIQAWDFGAGGNFVLDMQQAASEAERTIAILSETSLNSGYVQAEWAAAFRQDPTGKVRSFIPIRVRPCKLTGLWASIVYIDLLKHPDALPSDETEVELVDEAEAKQRILDGIATGRKKPTQKPAFPQKSATAPSHPKPVFLQKQMSPAKRQRLEQKQQNLQQEWSLRQEKLTALRQAQAIETSAAVQFQLKQQIQTEETAIAQLETQLTQLEQELSTPTQIPAPPEPPPAQNVQNISGGQGWQVNDPQAPVIQGGANNTFNFHYATPQTPPSTPQTAPQTILILAANPKQGTRSRLDEEVREIDQGLRLAKQREKFVLEQRWAVRPIDVRRAMLDLHPQIIHFTGHGTAADGLVLEDNTGAAKPVSPGAIAGLFELFADQVQCVILNACYSEPQATAIAQHIPYVIGMNDALEERASIAFAVAFYDALGAGRSIEFAYKLACNAIQMEGIEGLLIPILKQGSDKTP